MITTADFERAIYGPRYDSELTPEGVNYEDDEDDWANLFERDDRVDVYELFDGLRDDRD